MAMAHGGERLNKRGK